MLCSIEDIREQNNKLNSNTDVPDLTITKKIKEAEGIIKADLSNKISGENFSIIEEYFKDKSKIYDFSDEDDFVDTAKIANGSLVLIDNPGQDFTEDFADDTGHSYDGNVSEFVAGRFQQKDQTPVGATLGITYTTGIDGNLGNGVLTGIGYNGIGITNGKLDLSNSVNKYIDYDANGNADSQQTGCIRVKWTPKYTGAGSFQYLVTNTEGISLPNNRIRIYHQSTLLFVSITDFEGTSIVSFAEAFSPIADTEYEIELNWDITTGETRLFVDGTQLGATQTGIGVRDSNIGLLRIGKDLNGNGNADFLIDDLIIFSTVQHTSNYTKGYIIPESKYLECYNILPEMVYTGAGALISLDELNYTLSGNLLLALQIGRSGAWTYWDGKWKTGDGTKNYMCSFADFEANKASLDIEGEIYGQFKIYLPSSDIQGYISELTASLTAQIYPTDDPCIISEQTLQIDEIKSITELVTKTGDDDIKRVCILGGSPYYYNGSSWIASDYSLGQSNSASEIIDAIDELSTIIQTGISFKQAYIFHSENGITTPTITTDTIIYRYDSGIYSAIQFLTIYKACEKLLVKYYGATRKVDEVDDIKYFQKEYSNLLNKILDGEVIIEVGDNEYAIKDYPTIGLSSNNAKFYPRKGVPGFYPDGVEESYKDDRFK